MHRVPKGLHPRFEKGSLEINTEQVNAFGRFRELSAAWEQPKASGQARQTNLAGIPLAGGNPNRIVDVQGTTLLEKYVYRIPSQPAGRPSQRFLGATRAARWNTAVPSSPPPPAPGNRPATNPAPDVTGVRVQRSGPGRGIAIVTVAPPSRLGSRPWGRRWCRARAGVCRRLLHSVLGRRAALDGS